MNMIYWNLIKIFYVKALIINRIDFNQSYRNSIVYKVNSNTGLIKH